MTFDPATNEKPFALLSKDDRVILRRAINDRGGQVWFHYAGWTDLDTPPMQPDEVYRALPAPVVKSSWCSVCVTIDPDPHAYAHGWYINLENAKNHKISNRIGIIRLDLIDGKLSVEVEP